jgi:hypothetical protein
MSDGGKGSSPRPFTIGKEEYDNRWELTFGKKTPKEVDDSKLEDEAFDYIQKTNELRKD